MYWTKDRLKNEQYAASERLDARITIHRRFSTNPQSIWDFAANLYKFGEAEQILEVGCGTGEFWAEQRAALPSSCSVKVTDFSVGMLEKAKKRLGDHAPFRFEVADVEALPYGSALFNRVLAHFMLYHPASPSKALAEIRRVLKPGGKACMITTGMRHMRRIDDLGKALDAKWRDGIQSMSAPFCEENAEELIKPHFSHVEKYVHPSDLKVTDARVVVDYMNSYYVGDSVPMPADFFAEIETRIKAEIEAKGHFFIEKRVVFYIAAA